MGTLCVSRFSKAKATQHSGAKSAAQKLLLTLAFGPSPSRSILQGGGRVGGMAAPPEAGIIAPAHNSGGGGIRVENCYVFKSRLQEYAQKAGLRTPEYHTIKEGPPHEPIFKCTVVINDTKYDSLPGFFNRKAAEQSAAEVALMEIVKSIPTNAGIPAVQETGLCKNLLQEYAQKMNYAIPSYICNKQASSLAPFICTVEIGGIHYIGAAARTKKEAEIKAARTALLAIQGRSEGCANGATKYIVVPGKRQTKEAEERPIETPKPLKVKRRGFKKKWNKRKFMKNDQAANVEKVEVRVAGDVHDSNVPAQLTMIVQDPSIDTIMLHPDEDIPRVEQEPPRYSAMVQPNEEGGSIKPEALKCSALIRLDEKTTREEVELKPPKDATMVQPNEEARGVKLDPNREARGIELESLYTAGMVQPNGEATNMEEQPCNSAAMRSDEEASTIHQEPANNASLLQPS